MSLPPRAPPDPAVLQALRAAAALAASGQTIAALAAVETLLRHAPDEGEAHRLLGGLRQQAGDWQGAETALRRAVALMPDSAPALTALGDLLAQRGQEAEAESLLRAAVAQGPAYPRATASLAELRLRQGRAEEALGTLGMLPRVAADASTQRLRVAALSALQRHDEAVPLARQRVAAAPRDADALHGLAAALLAGHRHAEAADAARQALALRRDRAETWFVLGCALLCAGHGEAGEAALREAVQRRPDHADAQRELAQAVWMRTGDADAALATLNASLQAAGATPALHQVKAQLLQGLDDFRGAYAALAPLHERPDAATQLACSHAALRFDAARAVDHARGALDVAPRLAAAHAALAYALLCDARAAEAEAAAAAGLQFAPFHQGLLAARATAWRLLGDARYAPLHDYARVVRTTRLDVPPGWPDLDRYLHDLAAALHRLHGAQAHPLGQTLRGGSQTLLDLRYAGDPAIRSFFRAIDGPIRRHLAALGQGNDPLRVRNRGGYAVQGAWSVRLRAQGHHVDHIHPEGWLSSACYIELPADLQGDEGWLRFGQPGLPLPTPLPPEHRVAPRAGELTLFPSYLWHGTVPFHARGTRLTLAFDLVPA